MFDAAPRLAIVAALLLGGCTQTAHVLEDTRAYLDRTFNVYPQDQAPASTRSSAQTSRAPSPGPAPNPGPSSLREESPPPAVSTAAREASAARLREGLARLENASTAADREEVARIIAAEAWRGDADAQYLMSFGDPVRPGSQRDPTRAAEWLARAAVQGHPRAQHALAQAYERGDGVRRDTAWAAMWYERAARQGYPPAQQALALREIEGDETAAERADAYRWLAAASIAGEADAERHRRVLGERIDADARARLDAEASAFRPADSPEAWPDPPLIRYVERALAARGFDIGTPDGALGPRTRTALARFAGSPTLTPQTVARLRGR